MPILKSCCCGCSLQVGTMIIAVLYLIGSIPPAITTGQTLYSKNITYQDTNFTIWVTDYKGRLHGGFGVSIVHGIIVGFLILGAALEIGGLLLPWVILEVMLMIIVCVIGVLISAALFTLAKMTNAGIIVICGVILYELITVYCVLVVYSYYQVLRDAARATYRQSVQV